MSSDSTPAQSGGDSEDSLAILRKKLRFRAWHRGTREVDLIMGQFADAWIDRLSTAQLVDFQALLDAPDLDVYQWVIGSEPVPEMYDTEVMKLLQAFDFRVDGGPC